MGHVQRQQEKGFVSFLNEPFKHENCFSITNFRVVCSNRNALQPSCFYVALKPKLPPRLQPEGKARLLHSNVLNFTSNKLQKEKYLISALQDTAKCNRESIIACPSSMIWLCVPSFNCFMHVLRCYARSLPSELLHKK